MRLTTMGGGAAALALLGVLATAPPASATDERHGYIECNPGRVVRISSTTVSTGSPFAVGHGIVPGGSVGWSTPGSHVWTSSSPGGNWSISTTGTITYGGASCVPG